MDVLAPNPGRGYLTAIDTGDEAGRRAQARPRLFTGVSTRSAAIAVGSPVICEGSLKRSSRPWTTSARP